MIICPTPSPKITLLLKFCISYLPDNKTFENLLTLSDPGYFRQLTIQGGGGGWGALKAPPPPYDLKNYCVNLHHIIHVHFTRCLRHVPIKIFQKIRDFDHFTAFHNRVIPCQITQWLKRYPPPDFDENLYIWSIWSEKKICQIIAYLVKYFPRYGPLKFC